MMSALLDLDIPSLEQLRYRLLDELHDIVFHYGDGTTDSHLEGADLVEEILDLAGRAAAAGAEAQAAIVDYRWRLERAARFCSEVTLVGLAAEAASAALTMHDPAWFGLGLRSAELVAACSMPGIEVEWQPNVLDEPISAAALAELLGDDVAGDVLLMTVRCVGCGVSCATDHRGGG